MLKNLPMMMHETLTCYILGVSSVSGLTYASLRGNKIGARYVAKPNHHDMTKIIVGLVESLEDSDKVSEVVSRYVNLLKYSQVLKTALRTGFHLGGFCGRLSASIKKKCKFFQVSTKFNQVLTNFSPVFTKFNQVLTNFSEVLTKFNQVLTNLVKF